MICRLHTRPGWRAVTHHPVVLVGLAVLASLAPSAHAQPGGEELFRRWLAQHEGLSSFEVAWRREVTLSSLDGSKAERAIPYQEVARYRWPDAFVQVGRRGDAAEEGDSTSRLGDMATKRGVLPGGVWVDSAPGSDMYQKRDGASLRAWAWQHAQQAPALLALWWRDKGGAPGDWEPHDGGGARGTFDFDGRPAAMVLGAGKDGAVHLLRLEFLAADGSPMRWNKYEDYRPAEGTACWWPGRVQIGMDVPETKSDPILRAAAGALQGREIRITRFTPLPPLRDEDLALDLDGMLIWDAASGEVRTPAGDLARLVSEQPRGSGPGFRWGTLLLIGGAGLIAGVGAWTLWKRAAA